MVLGLCCPRPMVRLHIPLSYQSITYHTMPYYAIPYHTIPYHTTPCGILCSDQAFGEILFLVQIISPVVLAFTHTKRLRRLVELREKARGRTANDAWPQKGSDNGFRNERWATRHGRRRDQTTSFETRDGEACMWTRREDSWGG